MYKNIKTHDVFLYFIFKVVNMHNKQDSNNKIKSEA